MTRSLFLGTWLVGVRPKTLIASVAPVTFGALSVPSRALCWPLLFLTFLFAMTLQITTNLANDYFDFIRGVDNKDRLGPKRLLQSGAVSKMQLKSAICIFFLAALLTGITLCTYGGYIFLPFVALFLILSLLYTAGPAPISYCGLGEICVLLFFGLVPALGTYYLQAKDIASPPILLGINAGFFSSALLIANNLRDYEQDKQFNKMTLVARFGIGFGKIEYCVCIACAFLSLLWLIKKSLFFSIPFISLFSLNSTLQLIRTDQFAILFQRTAKWLLFHTLLVTLALLLCQFS